MNLPQVNKLFWDALETDLNSEKNLLTTILHSLASRERGKREKRKRAKKRNKKRGRERERERILRGNIMGPNF